MIAITGSGIISALGVGKELTLKALQTGTSGIKKMRHLPSCHTELPVGEVDLSNEQMKQMLHFPLEKEESRTVLMALIAAEEAVAEAKVNAQTLHEWQERHKRTPKVVLVSGTTVGGMDVTERHFAQLGNDPTANGYFAQHDCGSSTQAMADRMGIFTDCTTLSTACSSAANALMMGARMLLSDQADIAVCGGSEALSLFHMNGFHSLMILDKEPCRPFDATRAGLNLGEGAAYVVLERTDDATSRGIEPQAYLTGWGNACDAFHQTATSPTGEGAYRAMCQALETAQLAPAQIDYINAHGTGTANNDASEGAALKRVFEKEDADGCLPPFSSTKALTGHATSAAGSIESVICLLAMKHGFIPQSAGFTKADEGAPIPSKGESKTQLRHVMCNSFGFGGNDTSLIFSSQPEESNYTLQPSIFIKTFEATAEGGAEAIKVISQYVKPLEARRMSCVMKASLLTSLQVLEEAGISSPDAVVSATAYGCTENSEKILNQLSTQGEKQTLSPTLFMQSTHNTIGSTIAIRLACHGYNATYTQGERSLEWALRDAELLLREGKAHSVLVGFHDEYTPKLRQLLNMPCEKVQENETLARSHAILLVRQDDPQIP